MSGGIYDLRTGQRLPDDFQDRYVRQVTGALQSLIREHPEVRFQVERWIPNGIALLSRCPVCVEGNASRKESEDLDFGRRSQVHVPDGGKPNLQDRIAVYRLCRRHQEAGERGAATSVRWWATRDGSLTAGRVVVFLVVYGGVAV